MKPIRLSKHAQSYRIARGFSVPEVEDAIRSGVWGSADLGRMQAEKVFAYNAEWNGKTYPWKRVRPVFVETASEIVVVTVYTFYF